MIDRSSANIIRLSLSRMPLTAVATVILSLSPLGSAAQNYLSGDTVNISAVTVTAQAAARMIPYTVVRIDPEIVLHHEDSDLATILQASSLLYVKRYGNHGLASVSVRGMSGSHTLVTWNGLPLNTPGNGYSDFAVIPVHAISSVRITSGGSDLDDLSGYIGGKVELSSDPLFGSGRMATASLGAGSYGYYGPSAFLSYGRDHFWGRAGAWKEGARNDFRFINPDAPGGPESMRRTNAAFSSAGIVSDLYYRSGSSQVSLHLWFNDSDRELPGPVTTVQQDFGERQTDRSVRGVVNYSTGSGRVTAEVIAGGQHDINRYYHQVASNNGDNRSSTAMIRARLGYRLSEKTSLELRAGDSYERAMTLGYEGKETRNLLSVSLAGRTSPLPRLNLLLQLRQTVVAGFRTGPEFTAGASWLLSRNGEHLLKASLSRNSKLPCLNDLYWTPGGNPDLLPEIASGGEASWSFLRLKKSGARNSIDLTVHASGVSNLIQWVPGQSGLWQAENIRDVILAGTEARAGTEVPAGRWIIKGLLNYSFSRSITTGSVTANDRSVGKQLIYAPLHHANLNLTVAQNWFTSGISGAWESRRFTTSDNSEWLPASLMADLFAGAELTSGAFQWKTEIAVSNLPGLANESVRNYPMPLRTFRIKLTLTWSEKRKKDETAN